MQTAEVTCISLTFEILPGFVFFKVFRSMVFGFVLGKAC